MKSKPQLDADSEDREVERRKNRIKKWLATLDARVLNTKKKKSRSSDPKSGVVRA